MDITIELYGNDDTPENAINEAVRGFYKNMPVEDEIQKVEFIDESENFQKIILSGVFWKIELWRFYRKGTGQKCK